VKKQTEANKIEEEKKEQTAEEIAKEIEAA